MLHKITEIGIVLGYVCNFNCAHCVTAKQKPSKLNSEEIQRVISEINKHNLKSLLFVGGEPTLYIGDVNRIISGIRNLDDTKIKITTNGHFAKGISAAKKTLSSFFCLNSVQLSYDAFHAKFLPFSNVLDLYHACKELGLRFSVILTIKSPLDTAIVKKLWKAGEFPIGIQKVLPIGQANRNKIDYLYHSFDRKVLSKFCPSRGKIKYLCGQGFSVCCSLLVYNNTMQGIIHPSIAEHQRSSFYRLITSCSFSKLAKRFGVSTKGLSPNCSSQCILCEHIFRNRVRD